MGIFYYKNYGFNYSQEWTEFLVRKVYPGCRPMKHMDKSLIPEGERFHEGKLCHNQELHRRGERITIVFSAKGSIPRSTSRRKGTTAGRNHGIWVHLL